MGEPGIQLPIDYESGRAEVILYDEPRFAGQDIDSIEIMVLRLTVVDSDHYLVRKPVRRGLRHGVYPVIRGQVPGLSRFDSSSIHVPVLVTSPVLDVNDVAGVVCPEVQPDAPVCVLGHWTGLLNGIDRRDPDVEHPVHGGEVRDARSVVAYPDVGAFRVSKQRFFSESAPARGT